MATQLMTKRLRLRRWTNADRPAFHLLNSDPEVMAWIGTPMSRAESDAFLNRIEAGFDECGFGLWCMEFDDEAIGFVGLSRPWFRDDVEIGWRLRSAYWGRGLATEGALACRDHGLRPRSTGGLGLTELVSFTARSNLRSQAVMMRLGFRHQPDEDFEHPSLPQSHPLSEHVLFRLTHDSWATQVGFDNDYGRPS